MEGNRPSLSSPARRQAAWSHIPLGSTEQLRLLLLSMIPALRGRRSSCPEVQLTLGRNPTAELPSGWTLCTGPRKLPLLSLPPPPAYGEKRNLRKGMCSCPAKSHRNTGERQKGEEYFHACEYPLRASHLTCIIPFNHHCKYCPHFKDM